MITLALDNKEVPPLITKKNNKCLMLREGKIIFTFQAIMLSNRAWSRAQNPKIYHFHFISWLKPVKKVYLSHFKNYVPMLTASMTLLYHLLNQEYRL